MSVIRSNVNDVFGSNRRYEIVDVVEIEGAKYALLLPLLGDGVSSEVVILGIDEGHKDAVTGSYVSVTDEKALMHAYAVFAQRNKGTTNLVDTV